MNKTPNEYVEIPLSSWQKILNIFRPLIGLSRISPTVEFYSPLNTQPSNVKLLPAPPERILLPTSISKKE